MNGQNNSCSAEIEKGQTKVDAGLLPRDHCATPQTSLTPAKTAPYRNRTDGGNVTCR